MAAEAGHHASRVYVDQAGALHFNGAAVFDSNENDISGQLDDLNAISTAEFGFVDGVTAGTVTASKAMVVDANKDIGTVRHLTLSGNLVTGSTTLSEAELGVLDAVTAGTVTASKALVVDASKHLNELQVAAQSVTPNNDDGAGSTINAGVTAVDVGAVTNDANDWITLPALANVPVGHTIVIACNAGGAFELRTPTTSGEKINTVDCDGTNEYLCTDTEVIYVTKVSDTDGWVASARTALGAVATAVVPD